MYTGPHLPKQDNICISISPSKFNGTSTASWDKSGITIDADDFTNGNSANYTPTFQSNVSSISGAGTSKFRMGNNSSKLQTGSITVNFWFNLEGISINVGSNNNWRGLLWCNGGSAGYPVTMVLEQSGYINFSTGHTDGYRRYLNSSFTPVQATSNGWQMITYTYNKSTGTATAYKNGSLVRTGAMTTNSSNASPTSSGTALSYSNYTSAGYGHGGTNTGSNPGGDGLVPGEWGVTQIWNLALTAAETKLVYERTKSGYGL